MTLNEGFFDSEREIDPERIEMIAFGLNPDRPEDIATWRATDPDIAKLAAPPDYSRDHIEFGN